MTGPAFGSVRVRAREGVVLEIKAAAWRQVAAHGQENLSLRAVARELGVVSSSLYRYFPSRESLLEALAADAHQSLAERLAPAAEGPSAPARWHSLCAAARAWALDHPHQFALLDAHPLPDTAAPLTHLAHATGPHRAVLAWALLLGLLRFDLHLRPHAAADCPYSASFFTEGAEALGAFLCP